jgi:uncharacterized protein YjbI with pentapeptide repeats
MKYTIKNRWTDAELFSAECDSLKECVAKAVDSGANLRDADLSGADLRDADLSGANLSGADLSRANLRDAYLRGANLRGADLSRANLSGADLSRANLSDADLSDANLSGANLSGADLSRANLRDAYLRGANLRDADLSGANLRDADLSGANLSGAGGVATREECIARLDEIREHICVHGDQLEMCNWHGSGWHADMGPEHACQTSHCLAGWAQALCPDKETRSLDPVTAGVRLIPLAASRFWDFDESTKEWLEKREYAN